MISRKRNLLVGLFPLAIIVSAPAFAVGPKPPSEAARADRPAPFVEARLVAGIANRPQSDKIVRALQRFYKDRDNRPVWVAPGGPTARAKAVLKVLKGATVDGLNPSDYAVERIAALMTGPRSKEDRAKLEFLLSFAVVKYAGDLRAGRLAPRRVNRELFIDPRRPDPFAVIRDLAAAQDPVKSLAGLTPKRREYRRLKAALAKFRAVARMGGWSKVSPGRTVGRGDKGRRAAQMRRRLEQTGDIAVAKANRNLFDTAMARAVKRFQYRHGLVVDGRAGKSVVAAMNVPVEQRIRQILVNMERRRWMPDHLGRKYVFANVADFMLKVVVDGKTIFVSRVVVGKQYRHRTPVFTAKMTHAVINPYWTPTRRIVREEILPRLRRNPGYLKRQNMRVFRGGVEINPRSVNWSAVRGTGGYVFRQDGGRKNALGRIKFMFPNSHAIYMHDTPSRRLFKRTVRAFSHGCIRVQSPIKFGAVVLGKSRGWTAKKINGAVKSGKRRVVRLARAIPVHITYLTAWVNKDGTVNFRRDVYGRDKILARALRKSRLYAKNTIGH